MMTGLDKITPGDYSIYLLKDPIAFFLLIICIINWLLLTYLDAIGLFGCNTNIVAGVDGSGSAMYCSTCSTIKSTKQENDEHFNKSCACMVCKVHSHQKS
jgi:hypothetical protein